MFLCFSFIPLFCVLPSTSAFGVRIWQAGFTILASGLFAGLLEQNKALLSVVGMSSPSSLLPPPKKEQKYMDTWADK